MAIEYSKHLEQRLILRKIDYDLPKKVFEESEERHFDEETKHFIAIKEIKLYNKIREVMVAYIIEHEKIKLLTIHPPQITQKTSHLPPSTNHHIWR